MILNDSGKECMNVTFSLTIFDFNFFRDHDNESMADEQNTYFLKSEEEVSRLSNQHDIIKDGMNGLVLAPIDLSKPLRVLDSGTADGKMPND